MVKTQVENVMFRKLASILSPHCIVIRHNGGILRNDYSKSYSIYHQIIQDYSKGLPDCQIILPNGDSVWVELKSATGKLSPEQKTVIELLRKMRQVVYVVRPTDFDNLIAKNVAIINQTIWSNQDE